MRAGLDKHLETTTQTLQGLATHLATVERWGREIGETLSRGGRLLAAGNGGSAAEAQHLTAEMVGRYDRERKPLSALALHAETSTLTAIANDYGAEAAFARQVEAHGRPGDILVVLSTSGQSANVVAAAEKARITGMRSMALTGPGPNPLVEACDGAISVDAPTTAAVQEAHLVLVHLLCEVVEGTVLETTGEAS